MVSQDFIDRIEELRHQSKSRIDELQTNICPMIKNVYLNYQFDYWYNGYNRNLWEDDQHIYAVNEIPYCYDNEIRNTVFNDTLDNLVAQDKVWPFLLFINNTVIKWSDIRIYHDYDYSYIRITNIEADESINATMIYFPIPRGKIRYGEDNDILLDPNVKGLYFDLEGKRLESPEFTDLSVRFEILDDDIYFKFIDVTKLENSNLIFKDLPSGFVPTVNNVLLFNNDGTLNVAAMESERLQDPYYGSYGYLKLFGAEDPSTDTLKWALLMYNTAHSKSASHIYIREEDLDKNALINKFTNTEPDYTEGSYYKNTLAVALEPFNYDHEFGVNINANINNATKYITRYDYSLWNKVFIENSPIKSFTYTGAEFKRLADDKGYVHFSRKHSDLIEDVVMMFLNSMVYDNSIDISYTNNTINIPIFGILDDDHVEIVLFTKCNNNILDIVVEDEQTPVYIHPEYNLEDCYIMSEECLIASYDDVPDSPEHRKQYICDIQSYEVDENYNYKIVFSDPEYYGKRIKIVPKNQFRYYRFKQKEEGQFRIILPTQFNYCHDINRYMIFVNGKKIDKTEFTITIMNRYRPFDKLVLYLATILDPGDCVDIFYIPEILVEKYKEDSLTTKGYLYLSESYNYPKFYSLSKYTSMVFVNGLKVNPMDIRDVDMNGMIINPKLNNIYNVTVVEFISGTKEIAKYLYGLDEAMKVMGDTNYPDGENKDLHDVNAVLDDNSSSSEDTAYGVNVVDEDFSKQLWDNWKSVISYLSTDYGGDDGYEGLEDFYGKFQDIPNPDKSFKEDYAPLRAILYDIVADYYLKRENATTGSPFVYEFEAQEWYPNDTNPDDLPDGWTYYVDNIDRYYSAPDNSLYVSYYTDQIQCKLITLYPDHDKLLDYTLTDDLIADTNDVRSGQRFIPAIY